MAAVAGVTVVGAGTAAGTGEEGDTAGGTVVETVAGVAAATPVRMHGKAKHGAQVGTKNHSPRTRGMLVMVSGMSRGGILKGWVAVCGMSSCRVES